MIIIVAQKNLQWSWHDLNKLQSWPGTLAIARIVIIEDVRKCREILKNHNSDLYDIPVGMLIFTLSVSDFFVGTYHVIKLSRISLLVKIGGERYIHKHH